MASIIIQELLGTFKGYLGHIRGVSSDLQVLVAEQFGYL